MIKSQKNTLLAPLSDFKTTIVCCCSFAANKNKFLKHTCHENLSMVIALLSPQRVYSILDAPEGASKEKGLIVGLFTKSNDKE